MAAFPIIWRNLSTFRVLRSSMTQPLQKDVKSAHGESWKKWRNLFFGVCGPAIAISAINWQLIEEPKPPEFKKYSHLRIRRKKFGWRDGVKTLIHNPHTNPLPDGYETH